MVFLLVVHLIKLKSDSNHPGISNTISVIKKKVDKRPSFQQKETFYVKELFITIAC